MPAWPGASSLSTNRASASWRVARPASTSPGARDQHAEVAQRHADASPVAEVAAQGEGFLEPLTPELVLTGRAGEHAEAAERKRGAHWIVRFAEVRQAVVEQVAGRRRQPVGARDVAERGQQVADRVPGVDATEELKRFLEVHPRRAGGRLGGDEEPDGVHPEERQGVRRERPGRCEAFTECRTRAVEIAATLSEYALRVAHRGRHRDVRELLGQRAGPGVELGGSVIATRHVLVDAELVERVRRRGIVA